jgi:hypothetical protein
MPVGPDFRNHFVQHRDKLAGPKCGRSEALFTVPKSWQPPATLLHGVGVEECNRQALKQINQRENGNTPQLRRAEHQFEAAVLKR